MKELNAFYQVADLLRGDPLPTEELLNAIIESLRLAMQFPEVTAVRISSGPFEGKHQNFRETRQMIEARFDDAAAGPGKIGRAHV